MTSGAETNMIATISTATGPNISATPKIYIMASQIDAMVETAAQNFCQIFLSMADTSKIESEF